MNRDEVRQKILDMARRQRKTVENLRAEWVIANQGNIDFFDTSEYLHAIVVSEESLAKVDRMILGIDEGFMEPKTDLSKMLADFDKRIEEIEELLPNDIEI